MNHKEWETQFIGEWEPSNNAVFSRERVHKWLRDGEISEKEAQILLRLEYDMDGVYRKY